MNPPQSKTHYFSSNNVPYIKEIEHLKQEYELLRASFSASTRFTDCY